MALHAEPVLYVLRFYDQPGDAQQLFEGRAGYDIIVSVVLAGDEAWLYGLRGEFNRRAYREIERWLLGQGVRSARMDRRGRIRVRSARG